MLAVIGLAGGEVILLLMILFLIPISLACFAFWIWMLIHAIQNKGLTAGEKTAWVLVIALLHLIGSVVYFFAGRPKANVPLPPPQPPAT